MTDDEPRRRLTEEELVRLEQGTDDTPSVIVGFLLFIILVVALAVLSIVLF